MIWAAISINGWPIVGIRIIRVHLRMDRRGSITTACRMSCARDPGRTIRAMFDPLAVISTIPAYATRRTASVLHTHYKEEGLMRNARAILITAALSVLPVAAYSQGKPAPADAFLYIVWPPDGATLKGAFWCR